MIEIPYYYLVLILCRSLTLLGALAVVVGLLLYVVVRLANPGSPAVDYGAHIAIIGIASIVSGQALGCMRDMARNSFLMRQALAGK